MKMSIPKSIEDLLWFSITELSPYEYNTEYKENFCKFCGYPKGMGHNRDCVYPSWEEHALEIVRR